MAAKVEFYEIGVAKLMPISGVVVWVKRKGQQNAEITKVVNVNIKHHRYYLTPGFQKGDRRVTVRGVDIGDVPTKYTMTGLEPYEIPVVGELYVSWYNILELALNKILLIFCIVQVPTWIREFFQAFITEYVLIIANNTSSKANL